MYCNGDEKMYKGGTMKKDRKAVRLRRKTVRNCQKVSSSEYIHYGSSHFDPLLMTNRPKSNITTCINKPNAGLWASPVNSNWGWKDWCESEQFYKNDFSKYFVFKLKPNAKILTIRSLEDWDMILNEVFKDRDGYNILENLFLNIDTNERDMIWDYISKFYDAILVIMDDNYDEMHMSFEFNSWDCDSIVVFNPEVVNIVRHSA